MNNVDVSRRRGGLNLGEIPSREDEDDQDLREIPSRVDDEDLHNVSAEGEVAEDEEGAHSFGSNIPNNENYNLGSDLEDDL